MRFVEMREEKGVRSVKKEKIMKKEKDKKKGLRKEENVGSILKKSL